jgi:ketosteroid isomerase-like protein
MKRIFLPLATIVAVLLFSCNSETAKTTETAAAPSFSLDSAKAAIAASNASFGSCFANGDSVNFVSHYTSNACINPSNMARMCGSQAINAFFSGGYKMGIRNIKLSTDEVMGGKDGVIETGTYELMADKGVSLDKGKFIVIWKEENGKWKMHRDIWNTDMPAAAPAK